MGRCGRVSFASGRGQLQEGVKLFSSDPTLTIPPSTALAVFIDLPLPAESKGDVPTALRNQVTYTLPDNAPAHPDRRDDGAPTRTPCTDCYVWSKDMAAIPVIDQLEPTVTGYADGDP